MVQIRTHAQKYFHKISKLNKTSQDGKDDASADWELAITNTVSSIVMDDPVDIWSVSFIKMYVS